MPWPCPTRRDLSPDRVTAPRCCLTREWNALVPVAVNSFGLSAEPALLVVYASQLELPTLPRKTRFRLAASLYRAEVKTCQVPAI